MNKALFPLAFLAIAALTIGCQPSQEEVAKKTTSEQMDKAKSETKAVSQDVKDYGYAQKAEFVANIQGQVAEINRELDHLSAKIEKASDSVKAETKPKLQALRDQAGKLTAQLDEAKKATESTWDTVKSGAQKAFDALKESFQQSRQWLSVKIAP